MGNNDGKDKRNDGKKGRDVFMRQLIFNFQLSTFNSFLPFALKEGATHY
jgi:hypothetical protein